MRAIICVLRSMSVVCTHASTVTDNGFNAIALGTCTPVVEPSNRVDGSRSISAPPWLSRTFPEKVPWLVPWASHACVPLVSLSRQ